MTIEQRMVWWRTMIAALLALMLSFVMPVSGFAACTNDPAAAQNAANFINNTASLLNGPTGPHTPAEISAEVRDFVAVNPQALAAVIGLLKAGGLTPEQQRAIGTGLGLAAGICIRPDPTFAAEIQSQIAGTDSQDAKTAYAEITGNQLIGSVGGGGGGGSSGASGGSTNPITTTGSSFSTPVAFTSNSVSNTPGNFLGGTAGGAGSVGTTTTTTTTTNTTIICTVSKTCP
jgi:hypothetical protein